MGDEMSKVTRDGNFTMVSIPKKDLDSLVRFIAHSMERNPDRVLELSQQIVHGDLSKQDSVVDELSVVLDIVDWSIVLDGAESLELCDELAETIYEEPKEGFGPILKAEKKRHLRIVKVCVDCHKGFIKGESHDCEAK
jgi:hypothetical protein